MKKQPQSLLNKLWHNSQTKLLGWVTGIPGAFLASASYINTFISDPTFKSYLDVIDVPKKVTLAFATLGLLIWLAHGRKDD